MTLVACEAEKSENPLSPSVAGPTRRQPASNVTTQTLSTENAWSPVSRVGSREVR